MSMETLNVMQFIQLLAGYFGFTVGLPALVFYGKVKQYSASRRFLIYFTIGNFYIINLVQVLTLLRISNRVTLLLFTAVPAILLSVRFYHLPVGAFLKNLLGDCRHYLLRELGFRSFLRRRGQELLRFLRTVGKNLWRLLKELYQDIPFLLLLGWLIWRVCGQGILENWGYGASDVPVHNYWINGLMDNNIFIAGIYPMGMHCMLYYLAEMLGMPVYVTLRLFWLVQFSTVAVMILAFLKGCCKSRFLPYVGALMFVGSRYFVAVSYLRFGGTLPQEFGMIFILPSVFFLMEFFRTRKEELDAGCNRIRCASTWMLLGFAMSFSMTISAHFYNAIIAFLICVGIAVGYGYWLWRKEYLSRVILSGVVGVLLALLPMAVAFLTGKSLQGSMYWAMNVVGLKDYTELIFRILSIAAVAVTAGGLFLTVRGIRKGRISLDNRAIPHHSMAGKAVLLALNLLPLAALLLLGWIKREPILSGSRQMSFSLPNMNWLVYGAGIVAGIGLIHRFLLQPTKGAGILSMVVAQILLGLLMVSGAMGWPMLMEPGRVCIYFAYLIPVVLVMGADGAVDALFLSRCAGIQQIVSLLLAAVLFLGTTAGTKTRGAFGGGSLEMNEAILCTTNILNDNQNRNNTWTIVSANDELRMVEKYGRHTEVIEFLTDMEYWNRTKEVTIPTETVYFYIEKQPLNYANGYNGTVPAVSEEEAKKPLPDSHGISAYNGPERAVTMSRMYYWAQRFMELYPNEMKVYYENDRFVCYYIRQNVYRLYNFAIDYGYN